jgi:hypothetical protein
MHVVLQPGIAHFVFDMGKCVEHANPAIFVADIFIPFLIITILTAVKVQHVFPDEDETENALPDHWLDDFSFEVHDIVADTVVPFPNKLNDGKALVVVGKEHFEVKGRGAEIVPLGMDKIVIDFLGEIKFVVRPTVEGRPFILCGDVFFPPIIKWLDIVHSGLRFFSLRAG